MERQPSKHEGTPEAGRRRAKAYQTAMEAVFAIPIAMGIGWWVDRKLGSEPWGLLVGLGFGFATFIFRLAAMRRMVEEAGADAERETRARRKRRRKEGE
jgi:F0F1-type ATP synthase assembly protein I